MTSRRSHTNRLARSLAEARPCTYAQALAQVRLAKEENRLPEVLDEAGMAVALEALLNPTSTQPSAPKAGSLEELWDALKETDHGLILLCGPDDEAAIRLQYDVAKGLRDVGRLPVAIGKPADGRWPSHKEGVAISSIPQEGDMAMFTAVLASNPPVILVDTPRDRFAQVLAIGESERRLVLLTVDAPSFVTAIEQLTLRLSSDVPNIAQLLQTNLLAMVHSSVGTGVTVFHPKNQETMDYILSGLVVEMTQSRSLNDSSTKLNPKKFIVEIYDEIGYTKDAFDLVELPDGLRSMIAVNPTASSWLFIDDDGSTFEAEPYE